MRNLTLTNQFEPSFRVEGNQFLVCYQQHPFPLRSNGKLMDYIEILF